MGSGSIRRAAGALFRGVLSASRAKAGTFTDVPTTFRASTAPTDPTASAAPAAPGNAGRAARNGFPLRTAAALAASGLLASPLLAGTAHADPKAPAPPAKMSQIGGDRLGTPGVQVAPEPGAPSCRARTR